MSKFRFRIYWLHFPFLLDWLWLRLNGIAPTWLLHFLIKDAHGFDHGARGEVMEEIRKHG